MSLKRRLRGVLGIATTWGVAFAGLSLGMVALGLAIHAIPMGLFGVTDYFVIGVRGFLAGGLAGTLFASLVARRERGTAFKAMSHERMALWGFLACAPIPAIAMAFSGMLGLAPGIIVAATVAYGALGGAMGAATLRLARRAPELPSGDDEMFAALPSSPRERVHVQLNTKG